MLEITEDTLEGVGCCRAITENDDRFLALVALCRQESVEICLAVRDGHVKICLF